MSAAFDASQIDRLLADPKTYADPALHYDLLRHLRDEEPVRWVAPEGHRPFWIVTRHEDIQAVEGDSTVFLNAPRIALRPIAFEEELARSRNGAPLLIRSMNAMDGEAHRQMRGVTSRDFLRPNVEKLAAQIDEVAVEFVDRLAARSPACDFVQEVAVWYPLRVIMTLLGVPAHDEKRMLELTQAVFTGKDKLAAAEAFFEYFRPVVAERRANPCGDLASRIANATVEGEPLGEFETLSYFMNIATAGHDTTSATIAGGLLALIQHPEQMERLRARPELLDSAADEMIRWVAPVKHFFRTAAVDAEIAGQPIKAGEAVMIAFPSGGRDARVFDRPDQFLIDRSPNRHTALGHGVHACLGQHLARLEIRQFFRRLLERVEHVELEGPPVWGESVFISGMESMPIRFTLKSGGEGKAY
ncbi:MAG: cytochrome P450 [Bordetella sp.]|nr:cytochrome P450 [Bordetella sp.]